MKKKRRFFDFDTENLAVPEYHPRRRDEERDEAEQEKQPGEHHLHIKSDSLAVPEVVVDSESEDAQK